MNPMKRCGIGGDQQKSLEKRWRRRLATEELKMAVSSRSVSRRVGDGGELKKSLMKSWRRRLV
jgi:hypothetical protein